MDELIAAIGEDDARSLATHFGGRTVYVPKAIGDHHPLCVVLGRGGADRIAAWTGGVKIAVPKQPERRDRVRRLRRAGALTVSQIAGETGYSERQVYRVLREENDDRQPGLFD